MGDRIVVWIPSGAPGWDLEEARPYESRWVGGGLRTLYEVAAALAAAGHAVEVRGVVSLAVFDEICESAGARPELPDEPRAPAASDTVIVPEGIDDPEVHARLVLSPARVVLLMLGPLGLVGWPFTASWSPPDPLVVDPDSVARPEHFRGAAGLGYELWTQTPGIKHAADAAGVACRVIGNGVPGGYPSPSETRGIDVLWLRENRWSPLARLVARRLGELGVECVAQGTAGQRELLEQFGRARVLLHPLRIEGHSRIGCEARAMGAVPVVLSSNRFGVGLDEAGGALAVAAVSEMADAAVELLGSPERLARLSAAGMRSAREQVEWGSFVKRVDAAFRERPGEPVRAAPGAVGEAVRQRHRALERTLESRLAEQEDARADLDRHRQWLEATNGSLSWRATAPLRTAKRSLAGTGRNRPVDLPRGRIEWPPDGTERDRGPVDIHGWCLFPGSSVARVEMSLNGGPVAPARVAVERPPSAPDTGHPDVPICGFEHKPDLAQLPAGVKVVRVDAVATAMDGRRLVLDPVEYFLTGSQEPRAGTGVASAPVAHPARKTARPRALRADPGMRLLAVTHTLGYGGGSLYLLELLCRLRRSPGLECEVISLADGPLRRLFEDAAVPVHVTDGNAAGSAARYEGHIAELVAWSDRRSFDAVLVNTLGAFAGADLAGRLGLPAVWVVHESLPLPMFWFNAYPPPALHPHVRVQAEAALRRCPAVLFVAEATRQLFLADADPDRLVALPYGVESGEIAAARRSLDRAATRRRLGVDDRARVVLCLGTVEPRKAQAMLAQAFAEVADRHRDAQLVLVGATEDGYCAEYRAALAEYLARAGLTTRVRVEPVTADPWSWHAVADLLVCASDIESLPRSITEAMAFGTPVLSTRVFGVPELIEDGVDGFLCDVGDVAGLAVGLDRVLSMDRAKLAAVARAGAARVYARHDPGVYAAQVLRLLEGLVAHPDASPRALLAQTGDSMGYADDPVEKRAAPGAVPGTVR